MDVGGGNFVPVVYDRVCRDFTDPICVTLFTSGASAGQPDPANSGAFKNWASLTATTCAAGGGTSTTRPCQLADKGIVIVAGIPHGYISSTQTRTTERRPDALNTRNVALSNFGWSYYHALTLKVTKQTSQGLNFSAFWTWSKAIDTGSEATFTGVDTNSPAAKGNAALSLRGLSGFHTAHRVVINYGWELPWWKNQPSWYGPIFGGWSLSGVTTFQSGNPFTISAGYDVNFDGVVNERPAIGDPRYGYVSVDNGRALSPCPVTTIPCPDTLSQLQLPGSIFNPRQAIVTNTGNSRVFDPGGDGAGTIGRNTFFGHGMNNFDVVVAKGFRVREGMTLQLRMEWYNIMNRVTFAIPSARTLNSTTPIGRITAQRNPANFVNAARDNGSRMGQLAIRFIF